MKHLSRGNGSKALKALSWPIKLKGSFDKDKDNSINVKGMMNS